MKKALRPFLAALATALVIVPLIIIAFADNNDRAVLYLDPASKTIKQNELLSVKINLATNGQVGFVRAIIDFPADKLKVTAISASGSNFDNKVEESIDNTGGHLNVTRSASNTQRGSLLVAIVTFKALKPGRAITTFASNSKVSESRTSTNILANSSGGSYTISEPSSPPPPTPPQNTNPSPPASNNPAPSNTTTNNTTSPATTTPTNNTKPPANNPNTTTTNPSPTTVAVNDQPPPAAATIPESIDSNEPEPLQELPKKRSTPLLVALVGGGVLLGSVVLGGLALSRKNSHHLASVVHPESTADNLHSNILDDSPVTAEPPAAETTENTEPLPAVKFEDSSSDPTDLYTTAAAEAQAQKAEAQQTPPAEAEQPIPEPPVETSATPASPAPDPNPVPNPDPITVADTASSEPSAESQPNPAPAEEAEPKDMFELAEEQFHYDEKFKQPPNQ